MANGAGDRGLEGGKSGDASTALPAFGAVSHIVLSADDGGLDVRCCCGSAGSVTRQRWTGRVVIVKQCSTFFQSVDGLLTQDFRAWVVTGTRRTSRAWAAEA